MKAALELAAALRAGETRTPPALAMPSRIVAIGDPQASAARFFGALAAHGLLGDAGWLRGDARLVAMGDYFDFPGDDAPEAGVLILGWLAAHAPEHVAIVFGNHEAARVMELASVTDARFREAAIAARPIAKLTGDARDTAEAKFARAFPEVATPGYAARDYSSFTGEQRDLVKRTLVAGRLVLAATAAIHGEPALITHAGVTERELALLALPDRHPQTIADALNERLRAAIDHVAPAWRAGELAALSLEPLHVAGAGGEEGGGLLYHRPSDPDRPGADQAWEHAVRAPRRYDPRALPRGLVQIVGHTGHKKAAQEMPRWLTAGDSDGRGGVRTLRVTDAGVSYRRGIHPGAPGDAVVYMTDPEMHYVDAPADVAILDLL
ncbi:MAG: hypothetical protein ABI867_13505 [Kofleriaceae bacterium]